MDMPKRDRDDIDNEHDDEQVFTPQPRIERPRGPKSRHGKILSLERLREFAKNRYEGVLIASARARQLNAKKLALEERGMEEAVELKRMKMTTFAMTELVEGKIKVERPNESFEGAKS